MGLQLSRQGWRLAVSVRERERERIGSASDLASDVAPAAAIACSVAPLYPLMLLFYHGTVASGSSMRIEFQTTHIGETLLAAPFVSQRVLIMRKRVDRWVNVFFSPLVLWVTSLRSGHRSRKPSRLRGVPSKRRIPQESSRTRP